MDGPRSLAAPVRFGLPSPAVIVRSLLAVVGSALLMVGVFLPTSVHRSADSEERIVGMQSYFDDATGDATLVFLLAIVVLVACVFQRLTWMRVTGAAVLGCVAIGFAHGLFAEPTFQIPLIAPTVIEDRGWGWFVLWTGAALVACAGWIGYRRLNTTRTG